MPSVRENMAISAARMPALPGGGLPGDADKALTILAFCFIVADNAVHLEPYDSQHVEYLTCCQNCPLPYHMLLHSP
jgi:hypothetical protein